MTDLYVGRPCPEMLDYLLHRRSAKTLTAPGPGAAQIECILQAAGRVPDHGKMFPWYFIVFEGDARRDIGALLRTCWLTVEPDAAPAKLDLEAERFLRAPVVIAVVSKIREGKNPAWEQIMSAGAACMNLCLAANASGYATNWLSEWYSVNDDFKRGLGIGEKENIAGFIYIGTAAADVEERARPDMDRIVTHWAPGVALRKGDEYGHAGKGFPKAWFTID